MYGQQPVMQGRYSTSAQQQNNTVYSQQYHPQSNYQQYHPQEVGHTKQSWPAQHPQPYPNKNIHLPQPPSLIQPPALNVEENINTNSQFLQQRDMMAISNNQHSEFDGYHPQEEDPVWNQEQQAASIFWQQRCAAMMQRFNWFFQRFEILRDEYAALSDQMQRMDSEQEWHHFQQHHDQFHEKIIEMEQELAAAVSQNEQLMQQKIGNDSQSVWQQRYQQLLGNFKSLQEEMTHMETSGGRVNGVPPEQYHHLEDQYNELEYQYGEVLKELQKHQGGLQYQQQLEMQINQFRQEIDNYKKNYESLHNENVQLQNMIIQLENQNRMLGEKFSSTVDRSKFEELAAMIDQKEREIQVLQNDFKSRSSSQGTIHQYQSTLTQQNAQIEELKRTMALKERQYNSQQASFEALEHSLREQIQKQRIKYQQKINELHVSLSQLQAKTKSTTDPTLKIESLEKKLAQSNQQIANLNNTIKAKNQELTELRSLSYEVDRLKDIQSSYLRVVEERDKLADNLKKKHGEIDSMHKQIQILSLKIQEATNKRQEYSTRNLMAEIEDLNEQIRSSEAEINKLKSIIDIKEEYCLKLQEEVKKHNEKYIVAEQTLIVERENWKEKEIKLSSKNLQHQKRIKNLDYEFNLQLKETLEKEICALRKQNSEKQDTIRKMQEKEIMLASQLAIFQKQKGNFDKDISLLRRKEKQLQSLNEAQSRRFKELESVYLAKQQQLQSIKVKYIALNSELNATKTQENQLNSSIKTKNKKIEELQKQIAEYLRNSETSDKLKNQNAKLRIALEAAQDEADKLKMQAQSRISNSKVTTSMARPEPQKQQNSLIQQLQQENQYLKEQISKMLQKLTQSRAQTQKDYSEKQKSDKKASQSTEKKQKLVAVDLNRRLNEFNFKLQSAINQNEAGNNLHHSRSQQLVSFWQQERRDLIEKYESELNFLKQQLKNSRLDKNSQLTENDIGESPKVQGLIDLEMEKARQQAEFYKQKITELQQRNKNLIRINEELREKISSVIKIKQVTTTADYYKEQNKHLQNQNESLKAKLKKAQEENKQIKIELSSKKSKISQQYEFKMLELELVIQDLKRKVAYLQAGQLGKAIEKEEKVPERPISKYNLDLNISDIQAKKNTYKRESYKDFMLPDSPKKYSGIQQEFQSVLGNFKGESPRNYGNLYRNSINLSSYTYGDSRIDDYQSRIQRV